MEDQCEHVDGTYMGKCAICDNMVCGECFQTLFNTVICGAHRDLEDESMWELIGFFTNQSAVEERRYFLQEQSLTSIVQETDEDVMELYVPSSEKEDAFAALSGASEEILSCESCKVFFSDNIGACPICGVRQVGDEV